MNGQDIPLQKAADLIRKRKFNQARPILVEYLRSQPDSAQGWFLLSHTLTEPQKQEYALRQALKADPDFEGARKRLAALGGQPPAPSALAPALTASPQSLPTPSSKEPQVPPADLEGEMLVQSGAPKPERGPGLRRALIGIILILLFALIFIASRGFFAGWLANLNPTPTAVVPFKTLPPTWTPLP